MKFFIVTVLSVLLCAPAVAQEKLSDADRQEVGSLLVQAKEEFDKERFSEAIKKLERVYAIYPDPNVLYRIGQCHEAMGESALAVAYYQRYVDQVPDASDVGTVRAKIARLTPEIVEEKATLEISVRPKNAVVTVNGTVTKGTIVLAPGNAQVHAKADGFEEFSKIVSLKNGETTKLEIRLEKPEPIAKNDGGKIVGWTLLGVGIASVATGGVLFGLSVDSSNRVDAYNESRNRAYANGESIPPRPEDYDALSRRSVSFRGAGLITAASGVALVGLGITLLILNAGDTEVSIGPQGATFRANF